MTSTSAPPSLEAKLVVLGSQGVGKTSLVHRFVKNAFIPSGKAQSTVGASFLTTRVNDSETGTTIRLQIWDTAGQERFRSISRLYYRGAQAAILCYDVMDAKSFEDMGVWLKELRENCGGDIIVQVVGTKADVVAADPEKRQVPFERCVGYVAQHLDPVTATPGPLNTEMWAADVKAGFSAPPTTSPNSNRSSGFWGQEHIWDCAHEVSARDGEGIEEVFRVLTRKLVDQHARKLEHLKLSANAQTPGRTPGHEGGEGYFDLPQNGKGSFRVGYGDRRKSWLGLPVTPGALSNYGGGGEGEAEEAKRINRGRCC